MSRMFTLLLALTACGPVGAVVISDGEVLGNDPDIDGDTDLDTDTTAVPDPIYGEWAGERAFQIGRCVEVLTEFGNLIEDDDMSAACPDCELFYEVVVEPAEVCGFPVRTPTYRGLIFDNEVTVVNMALTDRGSWEAEPLAQGGFEQSNEAIFFNYQYEGNLGRQTYRVEGAAQIVRTN